MLQPVHQQSLRTTKELGQDFHHPMVAQVPQEEVTAQEEATVQEEATAQEEIKADHQAVQQVQLRPQGLQEVVRHRQRA